MGKAGLEGGCLKTSNSCYVIGGTRDEGFVVIVMSLGCAIVGIEARWIVPLLRDASSDMSVVR
jgi:hypothetical protein